VHTEKHDPSPIASQDHWWIRVQNILTVTTLVIAPLFSSGTPHPARVAFGALLVLLGAVTGISGVRALGPHRTPHPAPRANSELVQSGIYSIIRHPLYTSLMLVTFGWSILFKSLPALIFSTALAVLLHRKARLEEHYLMQRFSEYPGYAARVPRFFPRLRRTHNS
jgi:protein-S-isoprenylcysteine O-methyltransferase Ste14